MMPIASHQRRFAEVPVRTRAEDGPAAPKGLVAFTKTTRRPVLHRREVELNTFDIDAVPPIQLFDIGDAELNKQSFHAQRDEKQCGGLRPV